MDSTEFEIPVPWGHVAVKAWGDESNTPVFVVHGLGDNAGSFDRLMPFLPASFYYICIDLPSHGKSSPYPPYTFITTMDNVMIIKVILDYINRKKYIFMGHSWGGQTVVLFNQIYPEYFIKIVLLDSFYVYPLAVPLFKEDLRNRIEGLIKINNFAVNKNVVYYTYEEAIKKLMSNRMGGTDLLEESATAIAERALIKEGDKYRFSTDSRLKNFLNLLADMEYSCKVIEEYAVRCPMLIVHSTDFQYYIYKRVINKYRNFNNCTMIKVEGGHDVHNNEPQVVGPLVSKFLLNSLSKL